MTKEEKKVDLLVRYSPLQIPTIMRYHWNSVPKEPCHFIGEPSTVKSEFTYQEAVAIAADEKRVFVDWNKASMLLKQECVAHPEAYFVFADIRASETDIGELRLQNINGGDYITFKYNILFVALSHENAMGILFFDEMNLAPNMIKAQFYKIINDKAIGDIPISKNVLCVSAGNESEHSRGVTEDPVPLVLRRANYFLRPLEEKEFLDWGVAHGLHEWVVGFLKFRRELVHRAEYDLPDSIGQPVPRTWTKFSNVLNANPMGQHKKCDGKRGESCVLCEQIQMAATGFVGQAAAIEFYKHVRSAMRIDLDKIIEKPELIKEYDIDKDPSLFFAILSGIVSTYRREKDYKKVFPQAMKIAELIPRVEAGAFLLRSIKLVDEEKWRGCLTDPKVTDKETYEKLVKRFDKLL
jgi:hypothetical protein